MANIQKISSCLWFDNEAEEAAKFYTSIFKESKMGRVARFGKEGFEIHRRPEGSVMTVEFILNGREFVALNGGPVFKFTEAISFIVTCENQEEVDFYWGKLKENGDEKAQQCGWLKDKFGLSWQIIPVVLPEMMSNYDKNKAGRVMNAMLKMKKLDIAELQKAFEGK